MNSQAKLSLELATHPIRNRRLFFLCLFLLVICTAGVTFVSANLYFSFKSKVTETHSEIENLELKRGRTQLAEKRVEERVKDELETNMPRIDFINGLIYRKSFSWITFLSDLESALPPRSYIISMVPSPRGDLGMEVKIRVATPTLEDELTLYTRLVNLGFKDVLIRSEEQANTGLIFAEVSFIYESTV
ncbi:MAG: hypothetical protein PVI11_07955 [Candidatus Aminicenantes bacterium]|jgi:hypothetical protein